jgi:hypothetical protein
VRHNTARTSQIHKGRIASLFVRCATKANPAKAGDAKLRGYGIRMPRQSGRRTH